MEDVYVSQNAKTTLRLGHARGVILLAVVNVNIPIFEHCVFEDAEYDLFLTPLWVDIAIEKIRQLVILLEQEKIFKAELQILQHELRITTQRVNLFEKVKIPEDGEGMTV